MNIPEELRNEEDQNVEMEAISSLKLGEVNEWLDIESRRLFVKSEITSKLLEYIGYYILRWNEEDEIAEANDSKYQRPLIRIYINSVGGSLFPTMTTCDIIENSVTPVHTFGQAYSFSGAGLLLMSGHKRFAWKHSTFLYHAGSLALQGSVFSVHDTINFNKQYFKAVKKFVLGRTKISKKEYKKRYRDEWFMNSKDMLHYGIIDEIIGVK